MKGNLLAPWVGGFFHVLATIRGAMAQEEAYEPSEKHKRPWQRGRRGALCPADADGRALFESSVRHPEDSNCRYATDGVRAYRGRSNREGDLNRPLVWHGYPCSWKEVPAEVQRRWVVEGLIPRLRLRDEA